MARYNVMDSLPPVNLDVVAAVAAAAALLAGLFLLLSLIHI